MGSKNKNRRFQQQVAPKEKNLNNYIVPVQIQRIRQDVLSWRDCINEAERAYFPYRVKMQRMFADTELNGHVEACMNKRRNLTLLRDFVFKTGETENKEWTEFFKQQWFFNTLTHIIDALFYGYNLISLGDIENNTFKDIDIIKRWHISPDRMNVTSFMYAITGAKFAEPPYSDWHLYVPTPGDNGISKCGYGLLYKVAIYEIFCRNLLGFNGDFVELYAQPYRVGKTTKTEGEERDALEQAIKQMGSSGWAIIDPLDEISFLETAMAGTGWKGYENLEIRCEKKISKILLGHADAIDSIPGKLGNDGEKSPAQQSLEELQITDGRFAENIINDSLIPKMRLLGFNIPEGKIEFKNDGEKQETAQRENKRNQEVTTIAKDMSTAGLEMDEAYFTERTGIPCKRKAPVVVGLPNKKLNEKLVAIYR